MSAAAQAWFDQLPRAPVTRFAPSPTGELHLGHVVNALWTWGVARATGGGVVLRIEDHDRGRARRTFEAGILRDLEWLGLVPEASSWGSLRRELPSPWRQSDSVQAYRSALQRLAAAVPVYGCTCTRSQIAQQVDMGQLPEGAEVPYPGTCRARGLPADGTAAIRVALPGELVEFEDLRLGPQQQRPAGQCGDLLVRDALGNWTYQFAATVDDLRHGITLVVRGEDLLASTGRQILLGRLLGRAEPARYLHHPLLRNADGQKLSKREQAQSLRAMREGGMSAAEVLDEAAARSRWPGERWW